MRAWRPSAPRCQRCAIDLRDGHFDTVCLQCEDQAPEFDRAIAAVDYSAPWAGLLVSLKFQGATALARPLAQLLADAVSPRAGQTSLIVPVPLSAQRLRERGYNQAWLLAQQAGHHLGIEARMDLLTRPQHTERLMSLSAEERQRQIRQAFDVTPQGEACLQGKDISIVDDVMTTGATINACANALLNAGARSVSAWVVARTPRAKDPAH